MGHDERECVTEKWSTQRRNGFFFVFGFAIGRQILFCAHQLHGESAKRDSRMTTVVVMRVVA